MNTEPDHVYYNITIPHNDENNPFNIPTIAEFRETRSQAIIDNPSEYELSIVRFKLPCQSIPLFIFKVNSLITNEGPYSVTLSYMGTNFQSFLVFIPSNSAPPSPVLPVPIVYSPHYYVNSVQLFITMINNALATSFTALKTAFPGAPPTEAPYLIYDPSTLFISLICQKSYDPAVVSPTISIFFNTTLYDNFFLGTFNVFLNPYSNPQGTQYRFVISDTKNNSYDATHYIFTQESQSLYMWPSAQKIVFTTGVVPVVSEYINSLEDDSVNRYRKILTDFQLNNDNGFDIRSEVVYNPTAEYRMTDLMSTTPLYNFDLQIYWEDNNQQLHPLLIPAHDAAFIKILFRKRLKQ